MIIYSSIQSRIKQKAILQGSIIALIGAALLLWAGIFVPLPWMEDWGWLIWLTSLSFFALGLIPYRRLCRKELFPDTIELRDDYLFYYQEGKEKKKISLHQIKSVKGLQKKQFYGIELKLKSSEKLVFPYFAKRAQEKLLAKYQTAKYHAS